MDTAASTLRLVSGEGWISDHRHNRYPPLARRSQGAPGPAQGEGQVEVFVDPSARCAVTNVIVLSPAEMVQSRGALGPLLTTEAVAECPATWLTLA